MSPPLYFYPGAALRKLSALLAVLFASVAIAACGGDTKTVTAPTPAPQTQQAPAPQPNDPSDDSLPSGPEGPGSSADGELTKCGSKTEGNESGTIYSGGNSNCQEAAAVIVAWGTDVQANPPKNGTTEDQRDVTANNKSWTCDAQADSSQKKVIVACVSDDGGKAGFSYTDAGGGTSQSFSLTS